MNYKTIDLACDRLEYLLNKLPLDQQKQAMQAMYWEMQRTDLIKANLRMDNPMAFCMDIADAIKTFDWIWEIRMWPEKVMEYDDPVEMILAMLP